MKKKIFYALCLLFVLILSFYVVFITNRYNVQVEQSLFYGRTFLQPEHGRYISTFVTNLFLERLPLYFNIHPNDFLSSYAAAFEAVLIVILCLLFTSSAFIFSKSKHKMLNSAFIFLYIVVFLLLFNNTYISMGSDSSWNSYIRTSELSVFNEYPMSMLVYIPFLSLIAYYYIKNELPNRYIYTLILILAFFSGITVEMINAPLFAVLTTLFILQLLQFRHSITLKPARGGVKQDFTKPCLFSGVYLVYIISLVCYYINPNDEGNPSYGGLTFFEYIRQYLLIYLKGDYAQFIFESSLLLIPLIICLILLVIFHKKYGDDKKRMIMLICTAIISFLLFYLCLFFIGFCGHSFWLYSSSSKFTYMYQLECLFFLLITIGYLVDMNTEIKEKQSVLIKLLLCVFTLTVFYKPLIGDYGRKLNEEVEKRKELRKQMYIFEKYLLNTRDDKVLLSNYYYNICNVWYLQIIYPELADKRIIIEFQEDGANPEDIIDMCIFTEQELEELKFQNLMPKRQK